MNRPSPGKIFIILITILMAILVTSCPPDITAPMVALVEDTIAPTINITSPKGGDNYYSSVTISGVISDDVKVENDGGGQIVSLYYEIANDDTRKGKINIGLDDQITADNSFGSGTIDFDILTGAFSFTLSTLSSANSEGVTQPQLRDFVSITITAVDRNNNHSIEQLSLKESNGPSIDIKFYEDAEYNTVTEAYDGDVIQIECIIGNSEIDKTETNELSSFSWGFIGTKKGGTLDITSTSPHWTAAEGIYKNPTTHDIDKYTTFTPSTRAVRTSTDLPTSATGYNFYFQAVDIYGHTTYIEKLLPLPASLELSSIKPSTVYYSSLGLGGSTKTIQLTSKASDPEDFTFSSDEISSVECSFTSTAAETPPTKISAYTSGVDDFDSFFNIGSADTNYRGTFFIPITFGTGTDFLNLTGNLSAKITVKDAEGSPIEARRTLIRDAAVPTISGNSLTTSSGVLHDGKYFLKEGNDLSLNFLVDDEGSGITIGNIAADLNGLTPAVSNTGESSYRASVTIPATATDGDGNPILYSITATDNVGNQSPPTADTNNDFIILGPYNNTICTAESLSFISNNGTWARSTTTANDTLTLAFTSPRPLTSPPIVTIAGQTATVTTTGANAYSASFTTGNGETIDDGTDIPFSVSVIDIVGNTASFTNADGSTYKTGFTNIKYDKIRPLTPTIPSKTGSTYLNAANKAGNITIEANYPAIADGATVNLYMTDTSGTPVDSAVYDTGASFVEITFPGSKLTGEGSTNFLTTITDTAGNVSDDSPPLLLTVDTLIPTIENIADQNAKRAQFSVSTTCDGTGTAIASYEWTVTKGGSPIALATQGTSIFAVNEAPNTLNLATDGIADGTYNVSLVVKDQADNSSTAESFTFKWDAKTFTLDSVTGITADSYHKTPIQNVTANISGAEGGTPFIEWTADNPDFSFTAPNALVTDISSSADGSTSVTITIRDAFGEERKKTIADVHWDKQNPTIGDITDDQGNKKDSFTITPTCTDTSGIGSYIWTVTKGGNPVTVTNQGKATFAVNEAPNTLNLATDGTADGRYDVSLMVIDKAGNSASSPETFYFIWDAAQFTMNVLGGLTSNTYYNSAISAEAALTGNESGTSSIAWSKANDTGNFSFSSANELTTNISSTTNGKCDIIITVTDFFGLPRTRTETFTDVHWDNSEPTIDDIPNLGPKNSTFSVDSSVYTDGTGSAVAGWSWIVKKGGTTVTTLTSEDFVVNNGAGSLSLETANADDDGTYTVELTVTDQADNSNTSPEVFTFIWDRTPPTITAIDDVGPKNTAFTVTPSYSDGNGIWSVMKNGSTVTLIDSGTTNFNVNQSSGNTLSLSTTDGTEDGTYNVTLTVEDDAGNSNTEEFSFIWDNKQFVFDNSPAISQSGTGPYKESFTLSTQITGAESGEIYLWTKNEPGDKVNIASPSQSTTDITVDPGKDGVYTVHLSVTDGLSRSRTSSTTFTWDTTPPTAPVSISSNAGADNIINKAEYVSATPVTISAAYAVANSADQIRLYRGPDAGNLTIHSTVAYEADHSTDFTIADGNLTASNLFRVVTVDAAGNESSTYQELTLTLDNTPPQITFVNLAGTPLMNTGFNVTPDSGTYHYTITETGSGINSGTYSWSVTGPLSFSGSESGDTLHIITTGSPGIILPTAGGTTDGDYTAGLTIEDTAGNASTASFTFGWDGDKSGSKSFSALSPKLNSGGSGGNSGSGGSPSSGRITTANFDELSVAPQDAPRYSYEDNSQATEQASLRAPSESYSGSYYSRTASPPAVKTIPEAVEAPDETAEISVVSEKAPEEPDLTEDVDDYEYSDTSSETELNIVPMPQREPGPMKMTALSSKASASVTRRAAVEPAAENLETQRKPIGIIPVILLLLLCGAPAVIIIRKRRL